MPLKNSLLRASALSVSVIFVGCGATNMGPGDKQDSDEMPTLAANGPESSETHTSRQRGPIASSLSGPETPEKGVPFTLTAQIDRRIPTDLPLRVTLHLPSGVVLEEGLLDQLVSGDSVGQQSVSYVVRADEIPGEDVVVVIDMQGKGFGYHAEHPYRFGRSAPLPEVPSRTGRALDMHGKNFGRTIPLTNGPSR